jgi:drug/metabolite transporter (DMT)-like permease
MVLSIAIGYFVFSEIPTSQMLAGAGLIILAGVAIILREAHLGLERTKARRVKTPADT